MFNKVKKLYITSGQYVGAVLAAPSKMQGLAMSFIAGLGILLIGSQDMSLAQLQDRYDIEYNDQRVDNVINAIFVYLEGSFGALIMVSAGLLAIVSSAFGQYRAALGLLAVAVGAFLLRSLVGTFFNDQGIA
ncbi:hypothetical protein EBR25_11475 [bacterium]|nr:hypothetical protein [bacterium]